MHLHNVTTFIGFTLVIFLLQNSRTLLPNHRTNQNPHISSSTVKNFRRKNLNNMQIQKCFFSLLKALKIFILLVAAAASIAYHPVNGLESRKLDEAPGDQGIKCTPSCVQSPPPPSPPLPSPPPPCPPPPALPPPTPPAPPKIPPTQYCPPPPPSSYIYFTGPPGNLYPIDNGYNGAGQKTPSALPLLIASGILGLLALW